MRINELWTSEELCNRFKLKMSYVNDLRSQGRIPFIKIGRLVRYCPEVIYNWIESGGCAKCASLDDHALEKRQGGGGYVNPSQKHQ